MATTGTVALSAEVKALYDAEYLIQGQSMVVWDQMCDIREAMNGMRGQTRNFPIVESLQPNTAVLDELSDVSSAQMRANEVVITLQEYGGAVEVTKFVVATSYADVYEQAAYVNGYNVAESLDLVVRAVAGQGNRSIIINGKTRITLDGQATAASRLTASFVELLGIISRGMKMPFYQDGAVCTVMHSFPLYDLLQDTSVRTMAQYQYPELLFNGEICYWGGVRMITGPTAKAFWGIGATATSSTVTTNSAAINIADTTITVASGTNLNNGNWVAIIDGSEAANTWYDTNELMRVTSGGTTTSLTGWFLDPGPGDSGGARYAHPIGRTVNNNNSAYPIVILGPNSITKAYSDLTGPYGETTITGPFDKLGRFLDFGWYLIAGFSRTRNAWLLRGEVGSSQS